MPLVENGKIVEDRYLRVEDLREVTYGDLGEVLGHGRARQLARHPVEARGSLLSLPRGRRLVADALGQAADDQGQRDMANRLLADHIELVMSRPVVRGGHQCLRV